MDFKKSPRYLVLLAIGLSLLFYCRLFIYTDSSTSIAISDNTIDWVRVEEDKNEYTLITYWNYDGTPYLINNLYSVVKHYRVDSHTSMDFYYNGGIPVAINTGYYGIKIRTDENGRQTEITYLDSDGKALITSQGYACVKRFFRNDNSIEKELYFDDADRPIAIRNGIYGIRYIGNKTYYLNEKGVYSFRIDVFMNNNPWMAVIIAFVMSWFFVRASQPMKKISLFMVLLSVAFFTIVRQSENAGLNLELFWSYKQFFTNYNLRVQILNNIWLFIPLGAGIRSLFRKPRYLILPFLLSIFIEAAQYFFHLGLCEFDDVFSNTLGGCIGFLMAYEIEQIIEWLRVKRKKSLSVEG